MRSIRTVVFDRAEREQLLAGVRGVVAICGAEADATRAFKSVAQSRNEPLARDRLSGAYLIAKGAIEALTPQTERDWWLGQIAGATPTPTELPGDTAQMAAVLAEARATFLREVTAAKELLGEAVGATDLVREEVEV